MINCLLTKWITALTLVIVLTFAPIDFSYAAESDFEISNGVLISYSGFDNTVTIPGTVTQIGNKAFMGNTHLNSVIIPASVKTIGTYAFYYCVNLTSVTYLGNSLTSIGEGAFAFSDITDLVLPYAVTSVGKGAYAFCDNLITVRLNNSIKNVSESMFAFCEKLLYVIIPPNVVSIGNYAFENCTEVFIVCKTDSYAEKYAILQKMKHISKPTAPVTKAKADNGKITLSWNAVISATKYRIYSYDPISKSYTFLVDTIGTSYIKTGLENGTAYIYLVRAYNELYYSDFSTANHITAKPIAAPVVTAAAGDGQATLNWKPVSGAVKYFIYSYNPTTKTYTSLANVTGTSYTKTGLANSTLYTYLVRAYNGVNYSSFTTANHINVKPIATPVVTATAGDRAVTLKWKALTGADKYYIYTYNASTKQYTYVTSTTATSYVHKNLTNGTAYTYMVKAYNGVSYSQYSTHVTAKPIAAPKVTATPGNAMVTLKWSAIPGATKYYVYLYNSASKTYTSLGAVTTVSFVHKNLTNGTTYTYLVRANNGISSSAFTTANHVTAKSIATPN